MITFPSNWKVGIDWNDTCLILNSNEAQLTEIMINGTTREEKISRGRRQGCPLSPYLFNLFIESATTEMKELTKRVEVNDKHVDSIRFSDDVAILANSE